ncbi:Ion-translocating oxidoreductase complex subunit G [subsurface metagenome]
MKNILVSGGKLFIICAVAAVTLGGINAITEPAIKARKIQELNQALKALTPDAETSATEAVPDNPAIKAFYSVLKGGKTAGYILQIMGNGYSGEMKILARYERDGTIKSVKLMDNLETPGLGKKAEDPRYMEKFLRTGNSSRPVPVRKDMLQSAEADAITGATITFLGIARALAEGAQFVIEGEKKYAP